MSDPTVPDWISSIAAAVGAIAVVVGFFRADKKIDEVQTNARLLKRAEVAEDLIALTLNVEDAMKDMRNPLDSIPKEKVGDTRYAYQRRYDRVSKYNDLFQRLREAQIRERAIIGDKDVNEAVDQLFKARHELVVAIEMLADYADEKPVNEDDRQHRLELRRVLYGSFSEKDTLGNKISSSVQKVEEKLRPFARLEVGVGK